jgi:hypothetical protein
MVQINMESWGKTVGTDPVLIGGEDLNIEDQTNKDKPRDKKQQKMSNGESNTCRNQGKVEVASHATPMAQFSTEIDINHVRSENTCSPPLNCNSPPSRNSPGSFDCEIYYLVRELCKTALNSSF